MRCDCAKIVRRLVCYKHQHLRPAIGRLVDLGDEEANLAAQALHSRLHTRDMTLAHNDGQQCVMFTRRFRHARELGNVSDGS